MTKMYQAIAVSLALVSGAAVTGQQATPQQHARAGWEAIQAGRAEEASAAFELALRGAPREPTVLFGAGVAAHLRGQSDNARRFLMDALKYDPALTDASVLLGEV